MRHRLLVSLLLALVALAACAGAEDERATAIVEATATADLTPSISADDLLRELEARELAPTLSGESRIGLLSDVPGLVYELAGQRDRERLYIHQYPDAETAARKAQQVAPQVNGDLMDWINTPHFFRCANLVVVYLGKSVDVKTALTETCGPQFAGRP